MILQSKDLEEKAVLDAAQKMCAAIRTAPKTKGEDFIRCCVVTGKEKEALAEEMERLSEQLGYGFFMRDADNVRASGAVVLAGISYQTRGLGGGCALCNRKDCAENAAEHGVCVYDPIDLGIALGSAAAAAADCRVDSRIMFSVGRAALSLNLLGTEVKLCMGIPLSCSGKSPYFDRRPKK